MEEPCLEASSLEVQAGQGSEQPALAVDDPVYCSRDGLDDL